MSTSSGSLRPGRAEDLKAIVEIEQLISDYVSPLPLRAGIAAGPVILFEGDDYIGNAVNLAARLADLAEPGQVLAPADIVSSLMVNTTVQPLGAHLVPGMAEPVQVVELAAAVPSQRGA